MRLRVQAALSAAVCVAFTISLAGCGSETSNRAVVKGQVKIGDTPLNSGSVTFQTADNRRGSGAIDANGNYTVADAPVGDVSVAVFVPPRPKVPVMKTKAPKGVPLQNPAGGENMAGGAGLDPAKVVYIPEKYGDPATSGLTYKVERGEQTHNINLSK
jgi:hypothetical protein